MNRVHHRPHGRTVISNRRPGSRHGRRTRDDDSPPPRTEPTSPADRGPAKGSRPRARLVDAAKEVFEQDGFLDARISDIAEKAGLSHGSFYHYFESKEEVFREVAANVEARLYEPMNSVILDPVLRPPAGRAHPRGHPAAPGELPRRGAHHGCHRAGVPLRPRDHGPSVHEATGSTINEVASSIRSLQRHGLADARLNPDIAAAALGSMTYRFPEMWFVQGLLDCDFEEGVEQLTLLFVRALGLEDDGAPLAGRPVQAATG